MLRTPTYWGGWAITAMAFAVLLVAYTSARAEDSTRRHAFVVGVGKYQHINSLRTAEADAEDVGGALGRLGQAAYDVKSLISPTVAEFYDAWQVFTANLRKDDIAVVYFSGHGIEVDQKNFLAMADARPTVSLGTAAGYYPLQDIIDALTAKGAIPIIILDACRNDPFNASEALALGGLAEVKPPPGGAVLFAAAARQVALDFIRAGSAERNGLFTSSLLKLLGRTDLTVELLAGEVKFRVWQQANAAGRNQSPALWSDIHEKVCLAGPCTVRTEKESPAVAAHDCDAVAGHPDDRRHGTAGVHYTELDGLLAFDKCRAAVNLNPEDGRLRYQLGRALNRLHLFKESLAQFSAAAEMGDPEGMTSLAIQYRDGEGVQRNYELARTLLSKAIAAGSLNAMVQLGIMKRKGLGGPVEFESAYSLFEQARVRGCVGAQVEVGNAYELGLGVARDPEAAFMHWHFAAKKGHPAGFGNVGWAYAMGIGVQLDYNESAKWLRKAEQKGNLSAIRNLAWLIETGRLGAVDKREAFRRFQLIYGDNRETEERSKAAVALGRYYKNGSVVARDAKRAAALYREAIDMDNNSAAHWELGVMYQDGSIGSRTEADYQDALRHINMAIELGNQRARNALGYAYRYGLGVALDLDRAREEYQIAVENGDATALNNLGRLILETVDDPDQLAIAYDYFVEAYGQRNYYAAFNLGLMRIEGRGVERDTKIGVDLLTEAIEWGHPTALQQLCWYSFVRADVRKLEPPTRNWCDQLPTDTNVAAEGRFLRAMRASADEAREGTWVADLREAALRGMADAKCVLSGRMDRSTKPEIEIAEAVEMLLACAGSEWKYVSALELTQYSTRFRRKLQEQLKIYGLYVGPIDGVMGPASTAALYAWRKRGLAKQRAGAAAQMP